MKRHQLPWLEGPHDCPTTHLNRHRPTFLLSGNCPPSPSLSLSLSQAWVVGLCSHCALLFKYPSFPLALCFLFFSSLFLFSSSLLITFVLLYLHSQIPSSQIIFLITFVSTASLHIILVYKDLAQSSCQKHKLLLLPSPAYSFFGASSLALGQELLFSFLFELLTLETLDKLEALTRHP